MTVITRSPDELGKPIPLTEGDRYVIIVRPRAVVCRLSGLVFDTNKNFLLPGCVPDLSRLKQIYAQRSDNTLLIVGHTDTSGELEYNDELSLERAKAIEAYLKRDHDAWLARYESGIAPNKRWGELEDRQMLGFLPAGESEEEEPVRRFQDSRKLKVDGIVGTQTRTTLIKEYMAAADAELPATITTKVHGCGEHFPLDPTGLELDDNAADGEHDPLDRRVELFFFDGEIKPPPAGENSKAGSTEYPEWRKLAKVVFDRVLGAPPLLRVRLQLAGEPIANETYELRVDGHLIAISKTNDEGDVAQVIPHTARVATISVPGKDLVRKLKLQPEEEFPGVGDVKGVQIRLNQLGFFAGDEDGELSEFTSAAVQAFKRRRGLRDDSVLDDETRNALKEAYGS